MWGDQAREEWASLHSTMWRYTACWEEIIYDFAQLCVLVDIIMTSQASYGHWGNSGMAVMLVV